MRERDNERGGERVREEEERKKGAEPSSQYSNKHGMVKEIYGKKRKVSEALIDTESEKTKDAKNIVKYIGETSRSSYERLREHYKDFIYIDII